MRETQAIECLGGLRETLVQDLRRQGIRGATYAGPWMFQIVQDGATITESAKHIPTVIDIIYLHGDPPPRLRCWPNWFAPVSPKAGRQIQQLHDHRL
jgi:hypothetical protein